MRNMFAIKGNLCGERVRVGRALHKPPLTQEGLVKKIQLLGLEISKMIISRIERGERHVVDGELRVIAQALGVSMEWLVQDTDMPNRSN
jgi:transcriptional regulator with XRE-family HTH domain